MYESHLGRGAPRQPVFAQTFPFLLIIAVVTVLDQLTFWVRRWVR